MDVTISKELRTTEPLNHGTAQPRNRSTTEPLNLGTDNGNNTKCKLLNSKETAEFLGITKYTLINWLSTKRYPGLKSIKLGGA
ncbi:MAG: helix-turn-helix domain-containing protein [Puniceicoccales bacterium]|nr:helix-turn-helix domain-containing protein [Puniceicoccales bacterium]